MNQLSSKDSPLFSPTSATTKSGPSRILNGVAVSGGIAIGRAFFLNRNGRRSIPKVLIDRADIEKELIKLQVAIDSTLQDFSQAVEKLRGGFTDQADLLDAYIMICQDPKLLGAAQNNISSDLKCAEWAFESASQKIEETLLAVDSDYFRDRASDLTTVTTRVLTKLYGDENPLPPGEDAFVLLAHDLTPVDTLALPPDRLLALVTESGGRTSHTGILAGSLGIPCIAGVSDMEASVADGDTVIVDAFHGFLIVTPDDDNILQHETLKTEYIKYDTKIRSSAQYLAETKDGFAISVMGNLDMPNDTGAILEAGGEGIGLFRTEFGYISRASLPTEAELLEEYTRVIKDLSPRRVVLRTLDLGADKVFGRPQEKEEDNPALGLRAIRYCLRHQDIFRRQLRAILRAGIHGSISIMLPMISSVDELRTSKMILAEVEQELQNAGLPYATNIPVGTMIELPSAVMIAADLAKEVDFFSIGTNDLIQYSLGIDRGNKLVSGLYQPLHPAIVRSIKHVADMALESCIPVGVCGEMAADPFCVPLLIGLGVGELSLSPASIPLVKSVIRNCRMEECRSLAAQALRCSSVTDVVRLVGASVYSKYKDELLFSLNSNCLSMV